MRNIVLIAFLLIAAEGASAKEITLLGKVTSCRSLALVQCEISIKKSEFQSKSTQLSNMQLMTLTADKIIHVQVSKYSLQPTQEDIQLQLAGLISKKKDLERSRQILKKDQYVILTFKDRVASDLASETHKKKESVHTAANVKAGATPLFRKKTMRIPAKKGHVLNESVNQLSPGRESLAPDVEYGGASTYADIEFTH